VTAARRPHRLGQNYAVIVAAVTFVSLLVAAGLRAAPSVLMLPLQATFGWDRATVSASAGIGIFLYGLVGPFVAALMQTVGIRRVLLGSLTLMAASTFTSLFMTQSWQYLLTWGVLSGIGTGGVTAVLGAAVVNRWFATRQGLVMGFLTASTATGSLIFLPLMAMMSDGGHWRGVVIFVSAGCAILIPIVALLMPERPSDIGTTRFGEAADLGSAPAGRGDRSLGLAFSTLRQAARAPIFWLLWGTFFICGLTTNGLVGTHLIAYCGDHGIPPVQAAGLLSLMGLFDLFGTMASGWLTDRYDPRRLLFVYYGFRGLSLIILPFLGFGPVGLTIFAVFYGLDWIATVPPTVRLANLHFGERAAPIVFGWVLMGHQVGAAVAAVGAGLVRQQTGSYQPAFILAGFFGVAAAVAMVAFRSEPAKTAVAVP
jgi:predicted MFS family arabinose efflux permease